MTTFLTLYKHRRKDAVGLAQDEGRNIMTGLLVELRPDTRRQSVELCLSFLEGARDALREWLRAIDGTAV